MKRTAVICFLLIFISGCNYRIVDERVEKKRNDLLARQLANISVTAQAQLHENAPPVQQTATAIKTAADAGLKLINYEVRK